MVQLRHRPDRASRHIMEGEIEALRHVLAQIKNEAGFAIVAGLPVEAIGFFVQSYNKVLDRLGQLMPAVRGVFPPLPDDATAATLRMAARSVLGHLGAWQYV